MGSFPETNKDPSLVTLVHVNSDLTKPRRQGQRERQKTIGLMNKTTTLHVHHVFLYTFLPSLTTQLRREMTKL